MEAHITRQGFFVATRASVLFLLGAVLFVFLYSVLAAFLVLLPLPEEVAQRLTESGVNWAGMDARPFYQLGIHGIAGLTYGGLVTVYAVAAWPFIALSGAPGRRARRATRLYFWVVVVNLVLFAGLVLAG